jgi:hypothetical protein
MELSVYFLFFIAGMVAFFLAADLCFVVLPIKSAFHRPASYVEIKRVKGKRP